MNTYFFVENAKGFGEDGSGVGVTAGCEVDKNTLKNHHLRDWKTLVRMAQSQ